MNKTFIFTSFLLIFLVFLTTERASAQINLQNLSSVNVDNLTDQKIKELLQQAQNAGLSDTDILRQAQSRGVSDTQVQKLLLRVQEIRNKNSKINYDSTLTQGRGLNYKPEKIDTLNKDIFESIKPKIFGADLFNNRNLSFEPNLKLATPLNYIVGPDDQLNINVYGNSLVNWKLEVSPDGNINIPGIGIVNVGGKTIENATTIIKSKLAGNNYAIGRGTSVQVSLGNIRSIKVTMIGQLVKPGTYTLPSLATVFNALYAAGGPSSNGSYRQIEIIRNSKIIRKLDIYDFLVKGSQVNNIGLQDQDIIRVPTYRTRVELAGQIKIPALFEVLQGENLQTILSYAGGFTDSAYTARIKVSQISDQQRKLTDVVEADYSNYIPLRGDKYFVQAILNRYENRVRIYGAIFRPGEYELSRGLTLAQLIQNAAGLKEDAFTPLGTITRLKSDNTTALIFFNVRDVIDNKITILLQREDIINIASIFDLRNKYQVTINGSVRKPGVFAYAENMTVEGLIFKAGGFQAGASPKRIEVARRINTADLNSKSTTIAQVFNVDVDGQLRLKGANFVLQPFDIVSVYNSPGYEKQRTVKVEGEVLYPGNYTIQTKNEKISSLIMRAGGLTVSADVSGGSLKRENIAILGIDKSKVDSTTIENERTEKLDRLNKNFKDSTANKNIQPRNNYVGIDLQKVLATPGSDIDLLLEDGDILRIPKQQQIVRVNGEVLYPSAIVYDQSKSFKGYVLNAGGFTANALKKSAYIVYPNGTVKGTRKFLLFNNHPKVRPGSEIFVPVKPKNVGNTIATILGFTTGLASLGAIILGIISVTK